MIDIVDKAFCCGCSACVQRCPKHCISLQEDNEGFLYPKVDESLCVDCGVCEKVCPFQHPYEAIQPLQVLAAKNRNEEERMKSSSGGVFIALAKEILQKNGVVFGAVFDEKWEVKHTYTETLEGVYPMMGSKYMQSRIGNTYSKAEQFLKQGREVLYVGTPCQISGLKHFLRKEYDNLLAVDCLCHGVPSPGVWRFYLSSAIGNTSLIQDINFRDKSFRGWPQYRSLIYLKDSVGNTQGERIYRMDSFMKGFLSDLYLRPSCHACKCKNSTTQSDLTIGDFWGYERVMPDFNDGKGVGLVLVNSLMGEEALRSLDMEVRTSTVDVVRTFNPAYCRSANQHPKREEFFRMYSEGVGVSEVVKRCLEVSFSVRLVHKVKRVIKNLLCIS